MLKGAYRILVLKLWLVLQRLGVTVAGVYRQLYTAANPSSPWLRLILLLGLGLVKPSKFKEAHETKHGPK
jgi:hypothetical protein